MMDEGQPAIRRFNVIDGMITVAASTATFALARILLPVLADFLRAHDTLYHAARSNIHIFFDRLNKVLMLQSRVGFLTEAIIFVWLFAFAAMRLRRPRPPHPVVFLQPGMVAFWSAATAFAFGLVSDLIGGVAADSGFVLTTFQAESILGEWGIVAADGGFVLTVMCLAVPLSWGALRVARRWRPEAGWIDRFGRTLGFCWWAITWVRAVFLIHLSLDWGRLSFLVD